MKGIGNVTKNVKASLVKYAKYVAKKFEGQCRCPVLKLKECSETCEWYIANR